MANTISKVPGNFNYKQEIEYSETFEKFWGHRSFVYTQVLFFCCVTCLNVSSIVDTAQVIDTIVGHWVPGGTGGINLDGFKDSIIPNIQLARWDYTECSPETLADGDCVPFGKEDGIIFSLGYVAVLIIFVPMALMDLKVCETSFVCENVILSVLKRNSELHSTCRKMLHGR